MLQRTFIRSVAMRAVSSAASLTVHIALGAAVVLGTANTGRSNAAPSPHINIVFPATVSTTQRSGSGLLGAEVLNIPDHVSVDVPPSALQIGMLSSTFPSESFSPPAGGSSTDQGDLWSTSLGQEGPQVLTGPVPAYPELLRQAGLEGRVLLEATVDATGHVRPDSILVIAATNPAFVAAAQQAL